MELKDERIVLLVWHELLHAKYWEQYVSDYTGSMIDWRKWFNITAISFAIVGGSTWGVWKALEWEWVTPVMFGIMGIAQLLSAIQKNIVIDNETILNLAKLRTFYISYFNKLEHLYLEIADERITQLEAERRYFELRETVYPVEELKDSLNIKELKKIDIEVEHRVMAYLKSRYNVK